MTDEPERDTSLEGPTLPGIERGFFPEEADGPAISSSFARAAWLRVQGLAAIVAIGAVVIAILWLLGLTPWQLFWSR